MEFARALTLDPSCWGQRFTLHSPAAQCGIYHLHNDICRFFDSRNRSIFYGYDMGLLEDDGFHRVFGHFACLVLIYLPFLVSRVF